MAPFLLSRDAEGIIILEILRPVQDTEVGKLVDALAAMVAETRDRFGTVRILFDNRESAYFTGLARTRMIETMRAIRQAGDRTALLVTSSMMKVRAKGEMNDQTQAFMSEMAARTWLNAWVDRALPAMLIAAK